jgi:glycine/D-amino acid oxidase-like deaminating enzyme
MANTPRVCIVGGGVIGASIAFHLSEAGCSNITIVERTGVACGASGRAGGFLAKNWRSGAEGEFSKASFNAHSQLAERLKKEYSIDVMYRRLTTINLSINEGSNSSSKTNRSESLPKWITAAVDEEQIMGNEETTAQVHPRYSTRLCIHERVVFE